VQNYGPNNEKTCKCHTSHSIKRLAVFQQYWGEQIGAKISKATILIYQAAILNTQAAPEERPRQGTELQTKP